MNMTLARNALFGGLLLILAGCISTTRTRFEISQPGDPSAIVASDEDRQQVKDALAEIAGELRLKDFTASSLVPETIVFYQHADSRNPLKLLAWTDNDRIFVDLMQTPAQPGESIVYQRARALLREQLRSRFGERSAIVNFRELNRPPVVEQR